MLRLIAIAVLASINLVLAGADRYRELTAPPVVEAETPAEEGNGLIYLGEWTATAYCNCEICCGQWAGGNTASGAYPTAGHTVACNSLPFGTQLLIDGVVYTVEDTGYSPFGDAWVDIYFKTHEEACAYGMRSVSVYMIE